MLANKYGSSMITHSELDEDTIPDSSGTHRGMLPFQLPSRRQTLATFPIRI